MTESYRVLSHSRKLVVKIGSSTLSNPSGALNTSKIVDVATFTRARVDNGFQTVIVSSAAQVAGISLVHEWARKKDPLFRQALCAVGQVELMAQWRAAFSSKNLLVGQLLFTRSDLENPLSALNIRNTLFTLLDEGVIPIINENDSVSFEENTLGDNDLLAARAAVLWGADALLLLSDIDGVYSAPPADPQSKLIPLVTDIPALEKSIIVGSPGAIGSGGIGSKIAAARLANSYNIPLVLTNGAQTISAFPDSIDRATVFLPPNLTPPLGDMPLDRG